MPSAGASPSRSRKVRQSRLEPFPMQHPFRLLRLVLPVVLTAFSSPVSAAAAAKPKASPPAPAARVAVLYGVHGRSEGDQRYNQALSRYLVRWIGECGIAAVEAPDTEAKARLAAPCRVAWLVGVTEPSPGLLSALDVLLARGGRVVVANCLSREVCARVGVKPIGFRPAPGFAAWTGFRFDGTAPVGAPAELPMVVPAITECVPLGKGGATVRAHWTAASGKPTSYAAVLGHPKGFCLTASITGESSPTARRRLLLALLGGCEPDLWREAHDTLRSRMKPEERLRRPPRPASEQASRHAAALADAQRLLAEATESRSAGRTATATLRLLDLQAKLDILSGCALPRWEGAVRAVWDQNGYGFAPGRWDDTCERLRTAGVTDLVLFTATPLWTHATVPGLATSPLRSAHGDQLAAAIAAAHARGIRVHAWVSAFGLMNASASDVATLHAAGRLLVGADGKPLPHLNPRVPANGARLADTVLHLARNYDLDGIHLDYIRYGSTAETPTAAERARFEAAMKKTAKAWPADVLENGPLRRDYLLYRRYAIGSAVRSLRQRLRAEHPRVRLSAAVYGNAVKCRDNVGQDWLGWLSSDWIDWAFPMDYGAGAAHEAILDARSCPKKIRQRIVSGIGVTAAECDLDPPEVARQIDVLRRRGYGGFALFDLDAKLRDEVLPVLRP